MSTRSYIYEAASTSVADIFAVIKTHFTSTSIRYSVDYSSPEGIIISPNAIAPEIIEHQISIRHNGSKFFTSVDRLSFFTTAGTISSPPSPFSIVACPELKPVNNPVIGSLTVYITEEVDCITILTYRTALKRQSDWGLHCGIGFIPAGLNDSDYGIYGTINFNGRPELSTSSIDHWCYNTVSNLTGAVEGVDGDWYAINVVSSASQNVTLKSGAVFIPRPFLIWTRRMGDSASYDFILGYMKYIYWMPGNDAQFPRVKAENATSAYLYFDGNSETASCYTSVKWQQGVVPA